jgi:hypothetical protein
MRVSRKLRSPFRVRLFTKHARLWKFPVHPHRLLLSGSSTLCLHPSLHSLVASRQLLTQLSFFDVLKLDF